LNRRHFDTESAMSSGLSVVFTSNIAYTDSMGRQPCDRNANFRHRAAP
jgi:hypothetical protein